MNLTRSLLFNDVELTAIGGAGSCVVVRKNIETRPNKRATKIIIPGRNGAEYVDEGYFDNVPISYSLVFTDFSKVDAVINYLLSVKGFARLEDQYDTDIYRMARVQSVNPRTPDREIGYVEVIFECKPEKWLKATVDFTAPENLSVRLINDVSLCRTAHLPPDGGAYRFVYNGSKWTRNAYFLYQGYLDGGGALHPDEDYMATDYIQVSQGAQIPYRLSYTGSQSYPIIAFYDFNKQFVPLSSLYGVPAYREGIWTAPSAGWIIACYAVENPTNVFAGIPTNNIRDFGVEVSGTPLVGDTIVANISNPSVFSLIDGVSLASPSRFDAKPLIKVYGRTLMAYSTDLTLYIATSGALGDNYSLDIYSFDPVDLVEIDSEKEDFWCDAGIDPNTVITFNPNNPGNFPIFAPQGTEIAMIPNTQDRADFEFVEIEPRWYRI